MGERNIADIYFFEELRKTVGERLACSWLSEVNRKNDFKKIQTACASELTSLPFTPSPVGRNVPQAKMFSFQSFLSGSSKNINCSTSMDENKKDAESNDDISDSPKNLPYTLLSQKPGYESFAENVGLIFTDAAHTIFDR